MKLCIKDEPHFTNDLSAMLWAFITGRLSLTDFELFLYANIDGLSAVFTNEALAELLEQDYRALPPARLRQDLKDALQEYELPCECPKIPTTAALDIGFLRCIDDSVSLIDYVNQRILRTFSLKGAERRVHGYWELRRNRGTEVCFFQDGNVYKCQQCETPWLVILDESTVAYLFLELSVNDSIAISDLHSRLAQELGYRPTSLLPPLSMTREESQ